MSSDADQEYIKFVCYATPPAACCIDLAYPLRAFSMIAEYKVSCEAFQMQPEPGKISWTRI